jgi:hypothetical protein
MRILTAPHPHDLVARLRIVRPRTNTDCRTHERCAARTVAPTSTFSFRSAASGSGSRWIAVPEANEGAAIARQQEVYALSLVGRPLLLTLPLEMDQLCAERPMIGTGIASFLSRAISMRAGCSLGTRPGATEPHEVAIVSAAARQSHHGDNNEPGSGFDIRR